MDIAEAGLDAIDTRNAIKERINLEDGKLCVKDYWCSLENFEKIAVVGVGKCAMEAASALEEVLGDRLSGGIVLDVYKSDKRDLKKIECFIGTHPLPSEKNAEITKKLVNLLNGLSEKDLVIFIISGGGSTLLYLPDEGADCPDEKLIVGELMRSGADIREINTVRKHLSLARGGHLAKYAYPAQAVSLIFSDVPGHDMEFVASGPTFKDTTTIEDAARILAKYDILKTCGFSHCGLIETPKDDIYFQKVTNILFMSNQMALEAMENKARELGFSAKIVTDKLSGEAKDAGMMIVGDLKKSPDKTALLYGGETTVTVKNNGNNGNEGNNDKDNNKNIDDKNNSGKGGRNQELALSAMDFLKKGGIVLSLNTDGRDNTDHAGALCDSTTKEKAAKLDANPKDFLREHSSYDFFEKIGDYIETGYTGSNISDIVIAIKGQEQ